MKRSYILSVFILVLLIACGVIYYRSIRSQAPLTATVVESSSVPTDESKPLKEKGDSGKHAEQTSTADTTKLGQELKKSTQSLQLAHDNKSGDTLNLRDFGVIGNGSNETALFQKALDASIGKVLIVSKQKASHYLTKQLRIPSNSTLVFDSGVVIKATDDLEQGHGNFEALLRIQDANNVTIKGNGALFSMNKSAYKGEHNHIFMINGSSNVTISNVKANNSGGDGFYIGAYKSKKKYCENIVIKNCVAENNRRQGLSVISAKNLLVERCKFNNTTGTSPASGVDIEPNNNGDFLEKIKFVNCIANNNQRRGFMVQLSKITSSSKTVDIAFENCQAVGNVYGFASMYFDDNGRGMIKFLNCKASKSKYAGFVEESCSSLGVQKRYVACVASDNNISGSSTANSNSSSFYIYDSGKKDRKSIGNSVFENCVSISESGKVRNGISVVVREGRLAKNIVVRNFSTQGTHKSKVVLPAKMDKKVNGLIINE